MIVQTPWKCSVCGKEKTGERFPSRWKRWADVVICQRCKKQSLVNRVISMPVVSAPKLTQDELYAMFRAAAKEHRVASNVAMREYAKIDEGVDGDGKLKKWKPTNGVYASCREAAPGMDTNSLSSLLQRLSGTYSENRFAMHVAGKFSLPSFTRLQPVVIKGGSWKAGFDEHNRPTISVRFGSREAEGIRSERHLLRLAGGREFARQLADFRKIVSGEATAADMRLCPRFVDGKLKGIMARMCLTTSRRERGERDGEMVVEVGGENLLQWNPLPPIHLDEARGLVIGHRKRIQRLANDLKHERRSPTKRRESVSDVQGREAAKYDRAMKTFLERLVSHVVQWAGRQNKAAIRWRVSACKSLPEFPWARLRDMVKIKCDSEGIAFAVEEVETGGTASHEAEGNGSQS